MASLAVNPFEVAKAELITAMAQTPAPKSYKTRLFFLLGLCGLQFMLCILHLVFTFIDLRRRGKNPWLIKLQRVREGRMVAVNALVVYSLLNACSAIVLAVLLWRYYSIYFLGGSTHNIALFVTHSVTPAILAGCCYTFSNLAALASISRGLASRHATRTTVIMHNLGLPIMILFYFACSIPLGIITNNLANSLPEKAASLLVLLTTASEAFQSADPTQLAALAAMGTEAIAQGEDLNNAKVLSDRLTIALVALSSLYCITFAIANVASMSLALRLREQSRINRRRAEASLTSREVGSASEGADSLEMQPPSTQPPSITNPVQHTQDDSTSKPASSLRSKLRSVTQNRAVEHPESAALTRLSYDLLMSLPVLLVIGIIFPAVGVFAVSYHNDKRWVYMELRACLFPWLQLTTVSIVVGYFLINLFLYPGKYGQGETKSSKSASGSAGFRPVLPETLHITKLSVSDFNTFEADSANKDLGASVEGKKYQEKW